MPHTLRRPRFLLPPVVAGLLLAGAIAVPTPTPAVADGYKAPFQTANQRSTHGRVNLGTTCEPATAPVRDVVAGDASGSRDVRMHLYRYQRKLNEISDAYVRSNPANLVLSQCTLDWLHQWARHDALLGKTDAEGLFVRKTILASLAVAYLKIEGAPRLDPQALVTVRDWLNRLGDDIKAEYSTDTASTSRRNHHLAEAIWSVIAAGVASNDRALFDWSVERARFALSFVSDDGIFDWAHERGNFALKLQLKAVGPLVMIAEMAAANGENLYDAHEGALHRLVETTMALLIDPSRRASMLKTRQIGVTPTDPEDLAWLWVYRARFADETSLAAAPVFPAAKSRNLGGDVQLLYLDGRERRAAFAVLPKPHSQITEY